MAFAENSAVIDAISDNFEDPNWSFDYAKNTSSNGLWYGSSRGAPSVLKRVEINLPGGSRDGVLKIQTNDASGDSFARDDFCTQRYPNTPLGKDLTLADVPSYEILLDYTWLPSQWKGENSFGFRVRAKDVSLVSASNSDGGYYPSIWLINTAPGVIQLNGRVGDDFTPDFAIMTFKVSNPGTIRLGISWDSAGRTKYYARFSTGRLTEKNLLKTDTFSGRKMSTVSYHFLSLRYPEKYGLSPEFKIHYVKVYQLLKTKFDGSIPK